MGKLRGLAWIVLLATRASAVDEGHAQVVAGNVEAVYRAFFSTRLALGPLVARSSFTFHQLLSDREAVDERAQSREFVSYSHRDLEVGDVLESVREEWREEEDGIAVLQACTTKSPQSSGFIETKPLRLVVLLRDSRARVSDSLIGGSRSISSTGPASRWGVAFDVAANSDEREILKSSRLAGSATLTSNQLSTCMSALDSWLAARPKAYADERHSIDGRPMFHVAIASSAGLIVAVHFVERDGANEESGAAFMGDRVLLLPLRKNSADAWEVRAIRCVL